ncbi:MAG: hypothetical protein PH343_03410, partial [Nitrospira sp.]|nr:hypothetical protein [Nitrospira sp.]
MKKSLFIIAIVLIAAVVGLLILYKHRQPGKPILVQKLEKPAPIEPEPVNPEPLKPESVPEETHPKYKAKIAIVIDDLGYDNN